MVTCLLLMWVTRDVNRSRVYPTSLLSPFGIRLTRFVRPLSLTDSNCPNANVTYLGTSI
jgi:hypothetical protein